MKIRIISPYFLRENGALPKHFQLYLNSCGKNPEFEWLFITNAEMNIYHIPSNVTVIKQDFATFREFVQRKFEFEITLDKPYKLCDYKVLYGYIFAEYLEEYDFWGYADSTDLIWGKLSNYITEDILKQFDKIYTKGHLTLYRNRKPYTDYFINYEKDGVTYQDAIQSAEAWATDETGKVNISDAWKNAGFSEYVKDEDIADLSPLRFEFRLATQLPSGKITEEKNMNRLFEWNDGHVYGYCLYGNEIIKEEYAYVHFQKRAMAVNDNIAEMTQKYYLVPNQFVKENSLEISDIRRLTRHRIFYAQFFKLKLDGIKNRIRRERGRK